jgi:hypothetical protein
MRTAIYAVAAVACLAATPCLAGSASADRPITLAQADVRIGVERDYDRPRWREPYWRHRHEGCREVTIRERRGGEMIVRHIRRCD